MVGLVPSARLVAQVAAQADVPGVPGVAAGGGAAVVGVTATASCGGCDWHAEGDPVTVDKAAGKHARAGHPVTTVVTPA